MKRLHLATFAAALLMLGPLGAQAQEGTITYETTTRMDFELPPGLEHMSDQIPNSRTVTHQLLFSESASLMRNAPAVEDEGTTTIAHTEGDMQFEMKLEVPENETYISFDEGQLIQKRDFLGRVFLITGDTPQLAWRLTDERSEFLGYMAQKATAMDDTTAVEAWFTPEIPIPAGPGKYGGLPGMILVLDLNEGQTTYVAKELSMAPLAEALVPPKKGKKVTREEFDTIVEEKMKEVQAEGQGGGNVFIIRGN